MISNNVVEATRESRGIWASYADIENNQIRNWSNNNNDEWAIGHGDYNVIRNNTVVGFSSGIYCDDRGDNVVETTHIDTRHWGVYANNSQGDHFIENNTFDKYTTNGDWLIYVTNAASVTVRGNECEALGGSGFYFNNTNVTVERNLIVSPGRGIELTNQAGGKVLNNTLVTENGGDYGIKVSNLSTPVIRNNILKGYQTGMQIDNDIMNTNVTHNDLWAIGGELYTGTAIAPLIGEINTTNANGDESDVYGNLNLAPMFLAPDSMDYRLAIESPCINAGDPTMFDPDGTVVDMGAYFSNFVGCTDPEACNYSPNATVDDGSCQEEDECGVCGGDGIPEGIAIAMETNSMLWALVAATARRMWMRTAFATTRTSALETRSTWLGFAVGTAPRTKMRTASATTWTIAWARTMRAACATVQVKSMSVDVQTFLRAIAIATGMFWTRWAHVPAIAPAT